MTKFERLEMVRTYNARHGNEYGVPTEHVIWFAITYARCNFSKPFNRKERTYIVASNGGKACFNGMCGSSLWGDCMDGRDMGVRLDWYDWKIDEIVQIPESVARALRGEQ